MVKKILLYRFPYVMTWRGTHSRHTKIAPLPSKITYIKMDPLNPIRNGFANWGRPHSHFRVAWGSRHESSMVPKALKIATLQKKMAPIPPHTYRLSAALAERRPARTILLRTRPRALWRYAMGRYVRPVGRLRGAVAAHQTRSECCCRPGCPNWLSVMA